MCLLVDRNLRLYDFSENGKIMFKSPVTRKRSNATQEDVTTVEKVHLRHDVGTDSKIVAKKERRSRGPRGLASLSMTFREADYSHHTLANCAGTYLVQSHRSRTDPQIIWRSRLKRRRTLKNAYEVLMGNSETAAL